MERQAWLSQVPSEVVGVLEGRGRRVRVGDGKARTVTHLEQFLEVEAEGRGGEEEGRKKGRWEGRGVWVSGRKWTRTGISLAG